MDSYEIGYVNDAPVNKLPNNLSELGYNHIPTFKVPIVEQWFKLVEDE